jgi:hypothetical protein
MLKINVVFIFIGQRRRQLGRLGERGQLNHLIAGLLRERTDP